MTFLDPSIDASTYFTNDADASDDPSGTDPIQAMLEAVDLNALQAAHKGTGWVSGLRFYLDHGWTINYDAGVVAIGTEEVQVARPGQLTFDDPDPNGYPRRDAIRVGNAGEPYIVKGEPRPLPVCKPIAKDANGQPMEVHLGWAFIDGNATDGLATADLCRRGWQVVTGTAPQQARAVTYTQIIAPDGLPSLASGLPWYSDFLWYDPTPGFEAYYACWINSLHQPMIGAWGVHDRLWKRHPLSDTVLDYVDDDILHNYTGIGMDADGHLHLSGNEHTSSIKYIRSQYSMRELGHDGKLRDITAWADHQSMSGVNEAHCSFPMFASLPTGELLAMFPQCAPAAGVSNGGPTNSVVSLKVYRGGGVWAEIGGAPLGRSSGDLCLIDSHAPRGGDASDTATAFMASSTIDGNGDLHLIWNWRSDAENSQGWFYAKITGLHVGETPRAWADPNGTTEIQLPIARAGSGYSSAHFPPRVAQFGNPGPVFSNPHLLNNPAPAFTCTDVRDYPHTGFIYIVGEPSTQIGAGGSIQQFHMWFDDTIDEQVDQTYSPAPGWHVMQVSSFVTQAGSWAGGGTPAGSATRFQAFCTPTGKVYFIGCWGIEGFGGATWCYDLTDLTGDDVPPKPFKLHELSDQGDFHYDVNSQRLNRLAMLMTNKQRYYQDPGDPFGAGPNGTNISGHLADSNSILGLVVIDAAQMATIARGGAKLPTIKVVSSASASRIYSIGANAPTAANDIIDAHKGDATVPAGSAGSLVIGPEYAGKQLYARLKVRMRVVSGGGYLVAYLLCHNFQEINAQVMVSSEADNAVPIAQTPDAWVIDTPYAVGARVEEQSAWWVCTQAVVVPNSGHTVAPHSNPTHWDQFAAQTGFQLANICALWVIDGAPDNNVKATSWIALPNFRDLNGALGELKLGAWTGGNANPIGALDSATWELGVLDF